MNKTNKKEKNKNRYSYTAADRARVVEMLESGEYTHREITERTGVSQATLTRWNGKRDDIKHVVGMQDGVLLDNHFIDATTVKVNADGTINHHYIKTKRDTENLRDNITAILEGAQLDLPVIKSIKRPKNWDKDLAVLIPIGDAHIGMYSWAEETGADFNLEIAVRDICSAFDYLIDNGPSCDRAIIANVGDFLHYSTMAAKTEAHGNMLDAASRAPHMVRAGAAALRYCIEKAATKHNIVEVINAPGNHDNLLAHAMNIMLDNIYEKNERIVVHSQPTSRFYVQHGKVLIGVVHGHQTKDAHLPGIMASEKAKQWGETEFRYWFRGHHHHDSRIEHLGCTVEQVRTLAPNDAYAAGGGYLSGQDMKQIVYHKEFGEQGRTICGIEMLRSMLQK